MRRIRTVASKMKSVNIRVHPEFYASIENARRAYSQRSGLDISTNTKFTEIIASSRVNLIPSLKGRSQGYGIGKKRRRF
jgi:hypothetical protein